MGAVYHPQLIQGSEEWHQARCGLLTASEMDRIITAKTLKPAANDKERTHLYELLAQRITRYVEPSYIGDAMLRGWEDEIEAAALYGKTRGVVVDAVGFVTNDKFGFTLGYSPDGLIGSRGLIECKSRAQKYQAQTIVECLAGQTIPSDFVIQIQTGLMVADDREWCDFISYCGGMPMAVVRVYPDAEVQDAILTAAAAFEARLTDKLAIYERNAAQLPPTERKVYEEMVL